MDKATAQRKVKETLHNTFDKDRYVDLVRNLLNKIDETKAFQCNNSYVKEIYRDYVQSYERIATYTDPNDKKIDILIVNLQKETSLERARTAQRNFVAQYLKNRAEKDAGLIAFVSPDPDEWRFSFVKMEYKFITSATGKAKVQEEFTPAKRYSYLVGKDENSHTAQSRIAPALMETKKNPLLDDIEDIFSVEKVTDEFFDEYRQLFIVLKDALDIIVKRDKKIRDEFNERRIDTVEFTKKLLGQIVFLYFLQKKGWFGVGRDDNWGTGRRDFLRRLFDKQIINYNNFFNDVLEPLFYEALSFPRDDDFYKHLNCKIPFLNGGLFDPIHGYDWIRTDIIIPDTVFSNNKKNKQGDAGTGVLDVFDRYNFTVKEDEPLEKEVAVDPEMLGKVFENLLEIKDRKSKGTYYTPREIVHYMCEQSLINYLATELDGRVSKDDIETFIKDGEIVGENETRVEDKGGETATYSYKLPKSIREHAIKIDQSMAEIKVCDPAIGSGAFPVGMMSEIVKARNVLTSYIKGPNRTIYDFKRDCIHNSLYGVDIDPSAVEIAKLRLWLSLVVDETDIKKIKPLPNLDYKIMQGNSLLEEYEGIKLFDERFLLPETPSIDKNTRIEGLKATSSVLEKQCIALHNAGELTKEKKKAIESEIRKVNSQLKRLVEQPKDIEELGLFMSISEAKKKTEQLRMLQKEYFDASLKSEKDSLRKQIDEMEWDLIEATLKDEGKPQLLKQVEQLKKTNIKPFFIWKLHFAEVFREKGGFDVVIANPPYMKERDNKDVFEPVNNSAFGKRYHQGKMDYWFYFMHKAIDVVKDKGVVAYITSRYWLNSAGASKLINRIKEEMAFTVIVDIGKLKVFDNVAGQHMVAIYCKSRDINQFIYKKLVNNLNAIGSNQESVDLNISKLSNKAVFVGEEVILEEKIMSYDGCIQLGEIADISQGVIEAPAQISRAQIKKMKRKGVSVGDGVFVLNKTEIEKLKLNNSEKTVIKKYIDPSDVIRYKVIWRNKYLIYSNEETRGAIKSNPQFRGLKEHLDKYRSYITSSNGPYGLHRPRDERYFNNTKLVFKGMFANSEVAYDDRGYYYGFSFSSIISKDPNYKLKYVLALLNSRFALNWFYTYGKKRGGGVDIGVEKLRQFPVKIVSIDEQAPFVEIVDQILSLTESNDYLENLNKQTKTQGYSRQIDQMVCELYGLTKEEKRIINGNS